MFEVLVWFLLALAFALIWGQEKRIRKQGVTDLLLAEQQELIYKLSRTNAEAIGTIGKTIIAAAKSSVKVPNHVSRECEC